MKKLTIAVIAFGMFAAACGDSGGETSTADDVTDSLARSADETPAAAGETDATEAPNTDPPPRVGEDPIFDEEPDPKLVETTQGAEPPPVEENVSELVSHPDANVAIAMTDLVDRAGADASAINVVSVEEVTWSDGSLGCPLPGMRYTQALVNGTRIVLEVDGVAHEYHSGAGREPFYCANPSDPVSGDYGDQ